MKLLSLSFAVLGLALGIKAQTIPAYLLTTRPCNSSSIEDPVLTDTDKKALKAFEESPVFSALRKRTLDWSGDTIPNSSFICNPYYSCIAPLGKLMCVALGIDGLHSGLFITETGSFGSLRDGNFEYKQAAGRSGGRTVGNFLTGPYPTPISTSSAAEATDTEECGAAFLIGTKVAAGKLCSSQTMTTEVAAETTAAIETEECGAAFLIGTKVAAGALCTSTTASGSTATGAVRNNKVVLGLMAFGVAGAGLAGL